MDSDPRDPSSPSLAALDRDVRVRVDWRELAAKPPPLLPAVDQTRSQEAWRRLQSYRPDPLTLVDRRRALQADIERLVAAEEAERASKLDGWRVEMRAWSSWCELAGRVLCGDLSAYREAVDTSGCLADVEAVLGREAIELELELEHARATVIIDDAAEHLRAQPAASIRAVAVTVATRVARELLAALPVERAIAEAVVRSASSELDAHTHVVSLTRDAAAGLAPPPTLRAR